MWNPSDLASFPRLVRGVKDYTVLPESDYGRASIFYRAAAARPGLHHKRNAASTSSAAHDMPLPGEWWDMYISPPYPFDPEGNCRTFYFFERTSAYPFLTFRPSKSAEEFTTSVELLIDYIRLIYPNVTLKLLCGDYDPPTWVVAGHPENILNAPTSAPIP